MYNCFIPEKTVSSCPFWKNMCTLNLFFQNKGFLKPNEGGNRVGNVLTRGPDTVGAKAPGDPRSGGDTGKGNIRHNSNIKCGCIMISHNFYSQHLD